MSADPTLQTGIRFTLNGQQCDAQVADRTLLVDFIRDDLGLTGTHIGCDDGRCGACTVSVDGDVVKSCMMLARQIDGCALITVENISDGIDSALRDAFQGHHGLQCGYCTPGMLASAHALLQTNSHPDGTEIREAISGNLCRCTGYQHIIEAVLAAAAQLRGETTTYPVTGAAEEGRSVGCSIERSQDRRLLLGRGKFTADNLPRNTLFAAIFRSPHAHARIKHINVDKARAMPGVIEVLTGAEAAAMSQPMPPTIDIAMRLNESYAIALDRVRYHGEPVAAIAAVDPYVAEDALAGIEVEYELLTPVVTMDQALSHDAPRLYDEWPDNRCLEWNFSAGDLDNAMTSSAHRVRAQISHHRYTGVPLEGRVALAEYDAIENRLKVTLSTQSTHLSRTLLAQILQIPEGRIQVITNDVGGGFGIKLQVDAETIPCLLAMRTGRPVLWSETRRENLLSGIHARDYVWDIEGGFDNDGRITALRASLIGDCGCDGTNRAAGAGQLLVGGFYLPGNYNVPAYACEVTGLVTNKAPYGAYRGYGKDIANYGIERFMDIAAREINIAPNELRRRNLIQADQFPCEILTGPIYDSGDYPKLLAMAESAIDVSAFRQRQTQARDQGRHIGLGFAMMLEPAGGAIPSCIFNGYETATVRMMPEGDFILLTGMQDIGQGVETTLAQVVADEFKVAPSAINVVFGDTHGVPYGLGAWSSRGASFGVSAAVESARLLAEKLRQIGAHLLEVSPVDVELEHGGIRLKGNPERHKTYREIGNAVYLWPGPLISVPPGIEPNLEATYTWTNPIARWVPDETGSLSLYTNHSSGCFAVEVEVDIETGKITVVRLYVAHDCGTVINPRIVEGQLIGGCVQGLGGVLGEELRYDEQGHLLNLGFWDYLIPQAPDVPAIEIGHLVSPSPNTPLGTKGMGEGGPVGVPAAVVAAVEDALAPWHIAIDTLPLAPERILNLLDAARSDAP